LIALSVGGGFALIGTVAQMFATTYTNRVANRLAANRLSLDTEEARRKADLEERKTLRDERDDYHVKWQAAETRADAAETALRLMRHQCAAFGCPCEARADGGKLPLPIIHQRQKDKKG
jgi:hypothetical protein